MTKIFTREERLQQLYDNCQNNIFESIIGPFGLSKAMFNDKKGGNATTQHNANQGIYAKESEKYNREKDYKSDFEKSKAKLTRDLHSEGKLNFDAFEDQYTGETVASKRQRESDGKTVSNFEYDHVYPLSQNHKENAWMQSPETRNKISGDKDNIAVTTHETNRQKSDSNPEDFFNSNEKFDKEKTNKIIEKARRSMDAYKPTDIDRAKYHAKELAITGLNQAGKMAIRQSLGVLLVELVNGLFLELKDFIKHGIAEGKNLFEDLNDRLKKILNSVLDKIPNALSQFFEGGISGFMSNLITFLINNFITTAKKFVSAIREGFLGLLKAFKIIFFPPENLSTEDALREGLKLLTAVITSSVAIILEETILGFLKTFPFGMEIGSVLMAIVTGLLVSFVTYQIDSFFDSMQRKEEYINQLVSNAEKQNEFFNFLTENTESQLQLVQSYSHSIELYQVIGATLGSAALTAQATSTSLEQTINETRSQVLKSNAAVEYINQSQLSIENFLKNL